MKKALRTPNLTLWKSVFAVADFWREQILQVREKSFLIYLRFFMTALVAFKTVISFDPCQVFLTIFISFEPIGELQEILTLENIRGIPIFSDFEDMNLNTDLHKSK